MFYTYVLQSLIDGRFYTGYTNNLGKRFKDHNRGMVFATKTRIPFRIIYYEACLNKKDAKQREKYLKTGIGKRYLKQRLKEYLR